MPLFAPDDPAAKSFFSTSIVERPRIAASRAMPVPLTPPPITSRSKDFIETMVAACAPRRKAQIARRCAGSGRKKKLFFFCGEGADTPGGEERGADQEG